MSRIIEMLFISAIALSAAVFCGCTSKEEPVADNTSVTASEYSVSVTLKADGADNTVPATIELLNADNYNCANVETISANKKTEIAKVYGGTFTVNIKNMPVNADGSTYKIENMPTITVSGKDAETAIELVPVSAEEAPAEAVEQAATALAAQGMTEAANTLQQNAQTNANTAPENANETPSAAPAPAQNNSSANRPSASAPTAPVHTHSYTIPVTETRTVQDSPDRTICVCSCGARFDSTDAWGAHAMDVFDPEGPSHAYHTEHIAGTSHTETVTVGYQCSCGAMQ